MKTFCMLLCCFLATSSYAKDINVVIYSDYTAEGFVLYATNKEDFPVAVEFDFTLTNLDIVRETTGPIIIPPRVTDFKLMKLISINKLGDYSYDFTHTFKNATDLQAEESSTIYIRKNIIPANRTNKLTNSKSVAEILVNQQNDAALTRLGERNSKRLLRTSVTISGATVTTEPDKQQNIIRAEIIHDVKPEEEKRLAEVARQAKIEEDERLAEVARLAKIEEDKRLAEVEVARLAKIQEDKRLAEAALQAKLEEEKRLTEVARQAKIEEEKRLAETAEKAKLEEEKQFAAVTAKTPKSMVTTTSSAGNKAENKAAVKTVEVNKASVPTPKKMPTLDATGKYEIAYKYNIPLSKGTGFTIAQGYQGATSHKDKFAVDFAVATGSEVQAARDGVVVYVEESQNKGCGTENCNEYDNSIVVKHPDGSYAKYAHLKKNGAIVQVGNTISQGQLIGYSGNTGWTTEPSLHFEVFVQNENNEQRTIKTNFKISDGSDYGLLFEQQYYTKEY